MDCMAQKDKRDPEKKTAKKAVDAFVNRSSFQNDPNGSYTGHPKDEHDKPVQDADDL